MPSELLTSREGSTLILTLSDPATRNTLSPQVYSAGVEALNVAESDDSVRAVIVRGDGEHFCAGGDLNRIIGLRKTGPQAQSESIALFHQLIESLRAFPKPVIAAVEGFAAGGGMSLALACDLIVAASDAKFVMSYGKVGLTPDGGGSWHLARLLPRALALELIWLAGPIKPERLLALGLVNRVTDKGQALAEALALADKLAAMAPNAVAGAKELVARAGLSPQMAYTDVIRNMASVYQNALRDFSDCEQRAQAIVSLCVGGMVLARTTDDATLRKTLRASARQQALQLLGEN